MRGIIDNLVNRYRYGNYTSCSNQSKNPRDSIAIDPILGTVYLPCSSNVSGRNSEFDWKNI